MNEFLSTEESIIKMLRTVFDPEIPVNVYDLGLVYKIDVDEEKNVSIDMTMTAPSCTIIEKLYGTHFAAVNIYGSVWFTIIWAVIGVSGMAYILRKRLFSNPSRFLLHAAFAMILVGALITHIFGEQGTTHIRVGEQTNVFIINNNGEICKMPFRKRKSTHTIEVRDN